MYNNPYYGVNDRCVRFRCLTTCFNRNGLPSATAVLTMHENDELPGNISSSLLMVQMERDCPLLDVSHTPIIRYWIPLAGHLGVLLQRSK